MAPISFSVLRNRFRANLSYAPWRDCTKPGTLTWRATIYAKELITEQLEQLCEYPDWNPTFRITPDEQTRLNEVRDRFLSVQIISDVFVASFSTKIDSLSQWREYGSYNIGISGLALQRCAQQYIDAFLGRCVYDQPMQLDVVRYLVQSLIIEYRSHSDPQKLEEELLSILYRYGALLKHDSFREEAEWRIVLSDMQNLEFREHKNSVVPFVTVDVRNALKTRGNDPVVPLIALGPGNDRVAERTMRRLTDKMLGFEAFVWRSDTPYLRD